MLRTIMIGSCVYVQGKHVSTHPDGRITVRVDEVEYTGDAVPKSKPKEKAA